MEFWKRYLAWRAAGMAQPSRNRRLRMQGGFIGSILGSVASSVVGGLLADGSSSGGSGGGGGGGGVDPGQSRLNNATADASIYALDRYKSKFVPVEDQFLTDVSAAGSPAMIESKMGAAHGDAAQATAAASRSVAEIARRRGISPNSPAALALAQDAITAGAALDATAQTSARDAEINRGLNLKQAAIGIGRGLDSTAATLGSAASSGFNAASNAANIAYRNGLTERTLQQQAIAPIAKAVGAGVTKWANNGGFSFGGTSGGGGGWGDYTDAAPTQYETFNPGGYGGAGGGLKDGGIIGAARMGIPKYGDGGVIAGPGGPRDDAVPAVVDGQQPIAVSNGEAVLNEGATSKVLGHHLVNLINKLGVLRQAAEGGASAPGKERPIPARWPAAMIGVRG